MSDIDPKVNREGYDQWSQTYDLDLNSTVFADEEAFPPRWSGLSGKRVLEIGCGTGRHTQRLARLGNDVTALDLSPGMLAVARAKPGLERVRFVESDVFQFRPDAPYDAVICALVIEHVQDLARFFERVAAFLAPGARGYFSEIHPDRMQAGSGARFRPKGSTEEVRLASAPHTEAEFRAAIADAGLTVESSDATLATGSLISQTSAWEKYRGKPMLQLWTLLKP